MCWWGSWASHAPRRPQLSVPTASKNAGNTADDFSDGLVTSYQNKTTVVVVSSSTTSFRVRYQEIVAADVGVTCTGSRTQNQATRLFDRVHRDRHRARIA